VVVEKRAILLSFAVFFVFSFLAAGFETAFWNHIFPFPAPTLWLIVIAYLAIYRETTEGFISMYLIGTGISIYTVTPFGIILFLTSALFFILRAIRSRIFWSGPSYFAMICALSIPILYLNYLLVSYISEANNLSHPNWWRWLSQSLSTPLFGFMLYPLFRGIDSITRGEFKDSEGAASE
jgi:hypothetical protein